ncbi:MAG: hypothetical protein AAF633_18180 [Chloroflexota bacterium]
MTFFIALIQVLATYFLFFFGSAFISSVLFPTWSTVDTGYGPALAAIIAVWGVGWLSSRFRAETHQQKMGVRLLGTLIGALIGWGILASTVTGFVGILIPPILATVGYHTSPLLIRSSMKDL